MKRKNQKEKSPLKFRICSNILQKQSAGQALSASQMRLKLALKMITHLSIFVTIISIKSIYERKIYTWLGA